MYKLRKFRQRRRRKKLKLLTQPWNFRLLSVVQFTKLLRGCGYYDLNAKRYCMLLS